MSTKTWVLIIFGVLVLVALIATMMMFSGKKNQPMMPAWTTIDAPASPMAQFTDALMPDTFGMF